MDFNHKLPRGVKFVFEVFATSEWADSPDHAIVHKSGPALLEHLVDMWALCVSGKFTEVHRDFAPDEWGPGDVEDKFHLRSETLVVTRYSFWFQAHPKHAPHMVETRGADITSFLTRVRDNPNQKVFFFGDEDFLKASIKGVKNES